MKLHIAGMLEPTMEGVEKEVGDRLEQLGAPIEQGALRRDSIHKSLNIVC